MTQEVSTAALKGKKRGAQSGGKKQKRNINGRAFRMAVTALILIALLSTAAYFVNQRLEMQTYRLEYAEAIKRESAEFQLDPYLVAALIHCESSGMADACSPKGARGLMQIMPETGAWIAEKLAMPSFSEDLLYDADWNIHFGCWYLSYLLARYDGEQTLALAAYNAGPGNVKKWLEDPTYSEDGRLKEIPFAETEEYVKRVKAALEKYRELYEEELAL